MESRTCYKCQFYLKIGKIRICVLHQTEISSRQIVNAFMNGIECKDWRGYRENVSDGNTKGNNA